MKTKEKSKTFSRSLIGYLNVIYTFLCIKPPDKNGIKNKTSWDMKTDYSSLNVFRGQSFIINKVISTFSLIHFLIRQVIMALQIHEGRAQNN